MAVDAGVSLEVLMERMTLLSSQQDGLLKRIDAIHHQVEQIPLLQQRLTFEVDHQRERVDVLAREVEGLKRDVIGQGKSLDGLRDNLTARITADEERLKLLVAGISTIVGIGVSVATTVVERFLHL